MILIYNHLQIQSSLDKYAARRKKFLEEDEFESKPISTFARRAEAEINDSLYSSNNTSETSNYVKRRALKVIPFIQHPSDLNLNHAAIAAHPILIRIKHCFSDVKDII